MSTNNHPKSKLTMPKWIARILQCNREYPVFDKIVMLYIAVMLLFQVFFQISPIVTFLATTPLYSMQTYLGILGGVLILVDLFTTKKIWSGKYSLLLYAILVLAALASVRMISYGVKENLFKLCWAAIQFALVYSCAFRLDRELLKKYVKGLFYVLLTIWFIACCVSLYQYINQIGYMNVVNPLAKDSSSNRQGFYDNRLFGIFYTLNHAVYISLLFFLIALFYILKEKRIWVKIVLAVAEIVLLFHIILSGSRSAAVSFTVCALCFFWFLVRNAIKGRGLRKILLPILLSVIFTVGCVFVYQGVKECLAQVPNLKAKYDYQTQIKATEATTEDLEIEATIAAPKYEEDVLERENLEEDVSNGRISIWKDYIALYKEVGLLGLSPGNYMPYILENYPELYIVDYIKQNYPDKYESGIIYHVHSGYVMVYVSAGILGLLCLAVFIILCLTRLTRYVLGNDVVSRFAICAFLLVATGALAAVFDEGLFFQNNPHTTVFWFSLGVLMKECSNTNMGQLEHRAE